MQDHVDTAFGRLKDTSAVVELLELLRESFTTTFLSKYHGFHTYAEDLEEVGELFRAKQTSTLQKRNRNLVRRPLHVLTLAK